MPALPPISERDIRVDSVEIIYEDEAIIAVNKPARLPMHANLDLERDHLVGVLSRQLARRDGDSGYLGVHHRLDWGTSGIVIFTRTKSANAPLARQFETHSLAKVYWALVYGELGQLRSPRRVAVPLGEPRQRGGRVQINGAHAVPAVTTIKLLRRNKGSAWAEALLETGRKHQVRAHLLSLGIHIYGDVLYGDAKHPAVLRPMLHAASITLNHPLSGERLLLRADMPRDMHDLAVSLGLA